MTDTPEAVIAEAEKLLSWPEFKHDEWFKWIDEACLSMRDLLSLVQHLRTERDALIAAGAFLEAIEAVLGGESVSDFMLSHKEVRDVADLKAERDALRDHMAGILDQPVRSLAEGVAKLELEILAEHDRAKEAETERNEARGYLSRLLTHYAPQCEPLPYLLGLCTQIDNLLTLLPKTEAGSSRKAD